jgi:hypothetical protein
MEYLIDYSCRTEGHIVFFRSSSLVIVYLLSYFFFMLEYEKRVAKFYSFKSLKMRYYCQYVGMEIWYYIYTFMMLKNIFVNKFLR